MANAEQQIQTTREQMEEYRARMDELHAQIVTLKAVKTAGPLMQNLEKKLSEVSDKLWVCVEYQGTESSYGALNLGFSWNFTKDISVLCGYEFYNNKNFADTATIQLDINF